MNVLVKSPNAGGENCHLVREQVAALWYLWGVSQQCRPSNPAPLGSSNITWGSAKKKITDSEAPAQTCAFVVSGSRAQEPLFRSSSDVRIWQVQEQSSLTMTVLQNWEADVKKKKCTLQLLVASCLSPALNQNLFMSLFFSPSISFLSLQTGLDCPPCHWLSSDVATSRALSLY